MSFDVTGSIVALITPFHDDGSVNFDKLGELIDWHLASGTDAILVLGTTGESSTMSHEEDNDVCEYTVNRVAGQVPVIAGSGSNSTETMLEKSLAFEERGADGLLLITPYYNKTNTEGMYHHFADVADRVNIPCILYNVPGRTGCSLSLDVVERLAKHPNIAGIKDATGDMSYASKVARIISSDFRLYSGNDDILLPMLSLGASGVISVWANVMPGEVHDMVRLYLEGDISGARDIQLACLDFINNLFIEVNPIPVKTALNMLGWEVGPFRRPLWEMTEQHKSVLRHSMEGLGLL